MKHEIAYVPAMAPEELPRDEGVDVFVHDSEREVTLTAPTVDAIIAYVEKYWGDDDQGWIDGLRASAEAFLDEDEIAAKVERVREAYPTCRVAREVQNVLVWAPPRCATCGGDDLLFGVTDDDVEDGTYLCETCDHRGHVDDADPWLVFGPEDEPTNRLEALRDAARLEQETGGDVENALAVFVTDPKIRDWLAANDPQALAQARRALGLEKAATRA